MKLFSNYDLNRLVAHSTLHDVALGISMVFSAVFLLRQGLSTAEVYLSIGLILGLRFVIRPAVLLSVTTIGLRRSLMLGTFLYAVQSLFLSLVNGPDIALLIYCAIAACAQVFYWTCYHAMFAAAGDLADRGSQVGWRGLLVAIAGVVGPAMGGVILTMSGPWAAFGVAAVIELAAIIPLLKVTELPVARAAPTGAYAAARSGTLLFAVDGWQFNTSVWAWSIILFQALDQRYDTFGGWRSIAMLAAALGGFGVGRFIDKGHARSAIRVNAVMLAGIIFVRALCGPDPIVVIAVTIGTTMLSGLYMPSLMTAIYNNAKSSPCPFRFQMAAEAGWDIGGALACIIAAALCAYGVSLHAVLLIALPMVVIQAYLLERIYATPLREIGSVRN
jgi:DHA1 family inner membrane transport protein